MPETTTPQQTRRDMPLQLREAQLVPSTFNESDNSVEIVWTVGARVRRYDWWEERYYEEELVVTEEAVDMTRFESGAIQILDNHRSYGGVGAILGIATRGWIAGNEGRASVRLSEREELAGIVKDIRSGIIRSVSVGYNVARYEVVRARDRQDGGDVDLYRAISWTPMEISFVTVPADGAAGTRSADPKQPPPTARTSPCEFIETRAAGSSPIARGGRTAEPINHGDRSMTPEEQAAADLKRAADEKTSREAAAAAAAESQRAAAEVERTRATTITELCAHHHVPHLAAGLVRSGNTVDQARASVLEELARRDAAGGGHRNVSGIQTVADETQTRMAGIEEAILHRVDPKAKLTDNGRQFRGMSLLEIGREHLERAGFVTRGMDRMTLASNILQFRSGGSMTTSDFANVLAAVANKRLRSSYDENPGTYSMWARRAPNAPDFKTMNVIQLAGAPDLLKVNEHGEFKYGALSDGRETYAMLTYGRIVSLTRQALINDDLRAFDRLISAFGGASRRLENRTVYSQLTANAAMGDAVALFHASHNNVQTGAGSALQLSSLTTMRTAMRKQKGLQNEELNIIPGYLIVPAALEQTAYQLTSSQYVPAQQSTISEFRQGGRTALEPIVEPVLDADSATKWYAAASSSQVDTVEYCYLDGADGPVIESETGFEVDGISYKCRLDFAAKAIDFRGLHRADGA
jgi:hypothetical protein